MTSIRILRGLAVAVCSADDAETAALADVVLPIVGDVPEEWSPLLHLVAPELISLHFAQRSGKVMLGFDDPFRKEVNFRQIFGSVIPGSLDSAGAGR